MLFTKFTSSHIQHTHMESVWFDRSNIARLTMKKRNVQQARCLNRINVLLKKKNTICFSIKIKAVAVRIYMKEHSALD